MLVQIMKDGKTVNVDGYEMAWPLYHQASGIDLLDGRKRYKGKTLLVQISPKERAIYPKFEKLKSLLTECDLSLSIEQPFWKELRFYYPKAHNLFKITLDWLERK